MLGLPTRSDAIQLSPEYSQAVTREAIEDRLEGFSRVFDTIYPHNHVVEAYRDAGYASRLPLESNIWGVELSDCPSEVEAALQPETVRDRYVQSVGRFRTVLDDARFLIDHEESTVMQTADHRPLTDLPDSVRVEESVADYVVTDNAFIHAPGRGRGWKYTFNPYELANEVLDGFTAVIEATANDEQSNLDRIASMALLARAFEDSPTTRLLKSHLLTASGTKTARSFEIGDDPDITRMVQQNQRVGQLSDVALRFDELYFEADTLTGTTMIPAAGVLNVDRRMRYESLSNRHKLRFIIDAAIDRGGDAVINGVSYIPAPVEQAGQVVEGFATDRESYPQLVDLLGKPVRQDDGEVLIPADWAANEVRWIRGVMQGDSEALDAMVEHYDLNSSHGHPSVEKAIAQLFYSLRT